MNSARENLWKVDVLLAGSWRGATCVLLSNAGHHLVVDTGMPHETHQLVQALEKRGLRPEDVEGVINTHFHVDHVSNNSLFSKSLIYAPQESYDWCLALYSDLRDDRNWEKLALKYYPEMFDYERARTHMQKLRKLELRWWDAKRLGSPSRFRWFENHRLPEGLDGFVTSGHVPGHLSVIVENASQPALIAGDALLSREHDDQVLTMIPVNRKQFELDRDRILSRTGRILPGHDRDFALGEPGSSPDSTITTDISAS